ncbi:hypothetical protein BLA17378_03770 [Burkholderia aenigmatica]|uniref:DUF2591 domain-containing protein n=1 Tax=Burkholderia aenigmatica TaxID=2015348 RepID=A0ABY6XXU4_9BURK|nr:phage protein NinX family protein [Burkholderia aenigmatica]VWC78801.1 hypothetical protein BLA17378_03770 [Burkholderia aenigmatica]
MKILELSGERLDYWVANILGLEGVRLEPDHTCTYIDSRYSVAVRVPFLPSSDWAHGGPIIEHERIELSIVRVDCAKDQWRAISDWTAGVFEADTPLVAAMRAYVASKFGDEVPDEGR